MFPIGRCVTVDPKNAKSANFKIGEIQYIFTNPGCGDNAETHTVREWLSEFGIPVEDEFFKLWHQKIFQLGSIFRKAEKVCAITQWNLLERNFRGALSGIRHE